MGISDSVIVFRDVSKVLVELELWTKFYLVLSRALYNISLGHNDAEKTMSIWIVLVLVMPLPRPRSRFSR